MDNIDAFVKRQISRKSVFAPRQAKEISQPAGDRALTAPPRFPPGFAGNPGRPLFQNTVLIAEAHA